MRKSIFLIFLCTASYSCQERAEYVGLLFPKTVTLQGEVCNDDFFFNRPQALFIKDSLLILYDDNHDGIIHIFCNTGKYILSAVNRGRGPGEVITPCSIDLMDNKILICSPNLNRLIVYDLHKIIKGSTPYHTDEYSLFNNSDRIQQAKWYKNGSIAVKSYSKNMRFGFIDGEIAVSTYWSYPNLVPDQEENRSIWEYFSHWKFKPDYSKMVTTTYIGSLMEIFNSDSITDIKSEKLLPIHKPKYTLAKGAIPKWVTSSDDTTIGFQDLFVTDDHIYALIYGVNINDLEANLPSIYVLSWDGTPKVNYRFKERICTFCVDEQERNIYAIVYDDDGNLSLRRYSIL